MIVRRGKIDTFFPGGYSEDLTWETGTLKKEILRMPFATMQVSSTNEVWAVKKKNSYHQKQQTNWGHAIFSKVCAMYPVWTACRKLSGLLGWSRKVTHFSFLIQHRTSLYKLYLGKWSEKGKTFVREYPSNMQWSSSIQIQGENVQENAVIFFK